MSKKATYKVVSDDLNLILFIKAFKLPQERKLYNTVRNRIEKSDTPISVENYKEFVVKTFLVEPESFLELLPEDKEDRLELMTHAYEAIIGIYPPFSLEFVCQDLNTSTFFEGAHGEVLKHLKDKFGRAPIPPPLDTAPSLVSSLEELKSLEDYLKDNIIGQREAITSLLRALKLMASGLAKHSSFLFVGPTGVGKTQLAKLLGAKFSGNFYKINCAEYAGAHEYAKLIGAPPGYVGHTEKSLLGEKAEVSNRWVFLFDEIEKAHPKLYDFLLSLLDDGTCTDNLGNILDFTDSIFIFTSNQGTRDINRTPLGFGGEEEEEGGGRISKEVTNEVIKISIKKYFSPEFLNRLDDIVFFNPLLKKEVKEIVSLKLDELPIIKTEPLINYIVEGGYSEEYGARNIERFIKNNVAIKIADSILEKEVPKKEGALYTPRITKGEVKIIDTKKYQTSSL